jgi:UTP--glucose-1-phosphate uridylyltransferase
VDALEACAEKMRAAGLSQLAIDTFAHYHRLLSQGEQGTVPEAEIEPVESLPGVDELPEPDAEVLDQVAIVKLNGGLGTSMGMTGPKSLVVAKEGETFLDLIVRQVLGARARHGARLPLVLMDSFRTRDASLEALRRHPQPASDLPPDFLQGRVPKVRADDLTPVEWPADPELEWTPPGHGDVYTSLASSGMLDAMLERGYRYAFLSNSDNLGASFEPRIPGWLAAEGSRSRWRCATAPRATARAATSHARAKVAGCCCGRPRRCRTRTWPPSRTSGATSSSTPTTCGSICGRWPGCSTSATVCWDCR